MKGFSIGFSIAEGVTVASQVFMPILVQVGLMPQEINSDQQEISNGTILRGGSFT